MQLFVFLSFLVFTTSPQTLSLQVSSTAKQTGEIHLAVYASAKDYAADRTIIGKVKSFDQESITFDVELPSAGDYVISGYHDVNGNGQLDFNMMGIPKEPYGFVTPPANKWKTPSFEDIATSVNAGKFEAKMEFKLWKEY